MKPQANAMKKLVHQVARDVGDGASAERLFAQKIAFAAMVRTARPRQRQRRLMVGLAVSFAALAVVVPALRLGCERDLSFTVGPNHVAGKHWQWEITKAKQRSVFAFSQGSRFDLHPCTSARVAFANDDKVAVELRRGRIEANIVGNGSTRWMVDAGPWRVTVLGTRFSVNWQEERAVLDVRVSRGKVLVQKKDSPEHGVAVSGGNHFFANDKIQSLAPLQTSVAPAAAKVDHGAKGDVTTAHTSNAVQSDIRIDGGAEGPVSAIPMSSNEVATNQSSMSHSHPDAIPSRRRKSSQDWLVHYANGEYGKALDAAARYGIDALTEELDAVRLWKLQDAARVTRNYQVSVKILRRYRERFTRDRNARVAAFLLGRIAMDKNQFSSAAHWFNTYINEDSNGPLAEEAHGLLIIVYEKTGQTHMAQLAAQKYLNRYQGGAFAQIAKVHLDKR
ncbi:MAG: FecR domain-containing protein [Deltaproteobacteria bacterium]|nr:FecR domain-containing protein [Deltaproteobacteria bacterium]